MKAVFKLDFGHCQHQILCVNPVNRRRQFGLFVSLGLVITAAPFIALRPREPVYQGKRLGEWLRDFDRGPDPAVKRRSGNPAGKPRECG